MTFRDTIYEIFEAFNSPLPGYEAHIEMAPYRKKVELDFEKNEPKIASTLLLLYPKNNDIYFCLIERTEYKGTHSKQISFPGGRNENGETIKETALRECYEEIGVPIDEINIIGEMTQVYVPPSNYLIHPFVGYCDTKPTFIAVITKSNIFHATLVPNTRRVLKIQKEKAKKERELKAELVLGQR